MGIDMGVPNFEPRELWALSIEDFNEWRAQNDLPLVFDFFQSRLPCFSEWLTAQQLDKPFFCRAISTARLLAGSRRIVFVTEISERTQRIFHKPSEFTKEKLQHRYQEMRASLPPHREVEPYFCWARRVLGRSRFFLSDRRNNTRADRIEFSLWTSPANQPQLGRASIWKEFEVLKLGGLTLGKGVEIQGRNLDLCDLDYLEISDEWHGNYAQEVNFSSCRHLSFAKTSLHHWTIRHCHLDGFRCFDSEISSFRFEDCHGWNVKFHDSRIRDLAFENVQFPLDFFGCELQQVKFTPGRSQSPSFVASQYRRIRVISQEAGKRQEASDHFYRECVYERKALWDPYLEHRSEFPSNGYAGKLRDLYGHWESGRFSNAQATRLVGLFFLFHLKVWTYPRYLFGTLAFKLRYLAALLSELVWGHGERPTRILMTTLLAILGYAITYFNKSGQIAWGHHARASIIDAVYFSMGTFTTLGYGDIAPSTTALKMICATEALLGAFLMGLVVAGFSNKSRY